MRALLVVVGVLGCAAGVAAESTSSSMSVLLTVARTCTVGTLDAAVTLQCSRGVNSVSVNSTSSKAAAEVRTLISGTNVVAVSDTKVEARKPQPLVVLNF